MFGIVAGAKFSTYFQITVEHSGKCNNFALLPKKFPAVMNPEDSLFPFDIVLCKFYTQYVSKIVPVLN
jgi:hypothetical protein